MGVFQNINLWFENLLTDSYNVSLEGLALFRIIFTSYILIFGVPCFSWISSNPDILFEPPIYSLAAFFDGFPSFTVLLFIDIATIFLLIFILFGFKTPISSFLLTLLWVVGFSFQYSFNKIDHGFLFVVFPLLMSSSGWGMKYSLDSRTSENNNSKERPNAYPIFLMALFIGFGYFSAGYGKVFT